MGLSTSTGITGAHQGVFKTLEFGTSEDSSVATETVKKDGLVVNLHRMIVGVFIKLLRWGVGSNGFILKGKIGNWNIVRWELRGQVVWNKME